MSSSKPSDAEGSSSRRSPEEYLKEYQDESTPPSNGKLVFSLADHAKSTDLNKDLTTWLDEHLPTTTHSIGDEKYIWFTNGRRASSTNPTRQMRALTSAHQEMADFGSKCRQIDEDDNIPKQSNKKQGKSKKHRKDVFKKEVSEKVLPKLADEGGLTSGKWLLFKDHQWVDAVTRILAHSVLNGPLSKLEGVVVHTVKVTCKDQVKEKEWMIALFFEDFWDENAATRVAECLVREHGQYVRSGKSDLWSVLGITSKHWSGIRSTRYQFKDCVSESRKDELLGLYKADKAIKEMEKKTGGSPESARAGSSGSSAGATTKQGIHPTKYWRDDASPSASPTKMSPPAASSSSRTATSGSPTSPLASRNKTSMEASVSPTASRGAAAAAISPSKVATPLPEDSDTEEEEIDLRPRKPAVEAPSAKNEAIKPEVAANASHDLQSQASSSSTTTVKAATTDETKLLAPEINIKQPEDPSRPPAVHSGVTVRPLKRPLSAAEQAKKKAGRMDF